MRPDSSTVILHKKHGYLLQIKVKILPGVGAADGAWEIIEMNDFLQFHAPDLRAHIHVCKQFPPFHILNEELMSGGSDQGMSGGCYWKPFELSEEEYILLRDEMLTNPELEIEYDQSLEEMPTMKKWCGAVLSKHNPRRKNK